MSPLPDPESPRFGSQVPFLVVLVRSCRLAAASLHRSEPDDTIFLHGKVAIGVRKSHALLTVLLDSDPGQKTARMSRTGPGACSSIPLFGVPIFLRFSARIPVSGLLGGLLPLLSSKKICQRACKERNGDLPSLSILVESLVVLVSARIVI